MLRILVLIQLVVACIAFSTASFLLHRNVALNKGQRNHVQASSLSSTRQQQKGLDSPPGESSPRQHDNNVQDSSDLSPSPFKAQLSHHLVSKLDIDPLLRHISTYACTKRGKDSILSVLPTPNQSALDMMYLTQRGNSKPSLFSRSQRSRGSWYHYLGLQSNTPMATIHTFPIARNLHRKLS